MDIQWHSQSELLTINCTTLEFESQKALQLTNLFSPLMNYGLKIKFSICTLCFIFRVPLARKSITFICRQAFWIAGCQFEGMTTGKKCTQGFFPRTYLRAIASTWLDPLKKWNRVLDWYKKRQFCSFNKNAFFIYFFSYIWLRLSWFNFVGLSHKIHMLGWNQHETLAHIMLLILTFRACCLLILSKSSQ